MSQKEIIEKKTKNLFKQLLIYFNFRMKLDNHLNNREILDSNNIQICLIDKNWLEKWKEYIGYSSILEIKKNNKIKDEDYLAFKHIIEENSEKIILLPLNISKIYKNNMIDINSNFDIVPPEFLKCFIQENLKKEIEKIYPVLIYKNKYIIQLDNEKNSFQIVFLQREKKTSKEYYFELIIVFKDINEKKIQIINEFENEDINEWLKKNKFLIHSDLEKEISRFNCKYAIINKTLKLKKEFPRKGLYNSMTPIIPQMDIFPKNLNISNPNKTLVENQIKENQTFFLNRQKSTIHLKENKIQNEDEKGKFNVNITKTINGNENKIVLRSPPNKNQIGNKENRDKIKGQNQNGNEMKGETKVVLGKIGHNDCCFNDNSKSNVENSVTKIAIKNINFINLQNQNSEYIYRDSPNNNNIINNNINNINNNFYNESQNNYNISNNINNNYNFNNCNYNFNNMNLNYNNNIILNNQFNQNNLNNFQNNNYGNINYNGAWNQLNNNNFNPINNFQDNFSNFNNNNNFQIFNSASNFNELPNSNANPIYNNNINMNQINFFNNENNIINKYPHSKGLQNIGQTCYMNSTIQCFSNIMELSEFLMSNSFNDYSHPLTIVYTNLLYKLFNPINLNRDVNPSEFKKIMGDLYPLFQGFHAADSKDLVFFFLERLHMELNQPNQLINNNILQNLDPTNEEMMLQNFNQEFHHMNNSIISNIFYGVTRSIMSCSECNVRKYSFQTFNMQIFVLKKIREDKKAECKRFYNNLDLLDLFHYSSKEEILDGENMIYCNNCQKLTIGKNKQEFYKLPKILIIVLNRGKNNADFNEELNIPEKLDFTDKNIVINRNSYMKYNLISIITHLGASGSSGHFISYVRKGNSNRFVYYNDSFVSEVSNKDALKSKISNKDEDKVTPYILFYHQV